MKENVNITAEEYRILEAALRNAINTVDRNAEPKNVDISEKKGIVGLVGKDLNTMAGIVAEIGKRFLPE